VIGDLAVLAVALVGFVAGALGANDGDIVGGHAVAAQMIDPYEGSKPTANGAELHLAERIAAALEGIDIHRVLAAEQLHIRVDWRRHGHLAALTGDETAENHGIGLRRLFDRLTLRTHQDEMPAGDFDLVARNDL
jgi:hypothetical protein